MSTSKRLQAMVSKVLDEVALNDLAEWSGISYDALRSYRQGRRTPAPDVIRRIALAIRSRAGELTTIADRLEAELERHS